MRIATKGKPIAAATAVTISASRRPIEAERRERLATDEDDARAEASARLAGEWSLAGTSEVEGEAAESDPVLAGEDALREFPADEILLAGGAAANGGVEAALRRYGLPVTRLRESRPVRERSPLREAIRGFARGRSKATP